MKLESAISYSAYPAKIGILLMWEYSSAEIFKKAESTSKCNTG